MKIFYAIGDFVFLHYDKAETHAKDIIKANSNEIVTIQKVTKTETTLENGSVETRFKVIGNFYLNKLSFL